MFTINVLFLFLYSGCLLNFQHVLLSLKHGWNFLISSFVDISSSLPLWMKSLDHWIAVVC